MKTLLEFELSENSFFDNSYIKNRLKREAEEKPYASPTVVESAGVRFVAIANFHDAIIMEITRTERYGKNCVLLRVDFNGSTTEFKKGFRKFDISLLNAEYTEPPIKSKDLHVISLDCVEQAHNLAICIELAYFAGAEAHTCYCKIECDGIEVKPHK